MRKSGLQKQIAFIFDDVPVPDQDPKSMSLPIQPPMDSAADTDTPAPGQPAPTAAATQAQGIHTPIVSTLRPKPLPRVKVAAAARQKSTEALARQLKKTLYGSGSSKMDPRQKKMTIMVGVLTIVFAGVLVMTFGGMGETKGKSAKSKMSETTSVETVQTQPLKQWQIPEPLPAQMRDPMDPQKIVVEPQQTAQQDGQLTVRGIVFSQNNPSAIINDQIIREGGSLDGVTIVKINKDTVEFEKGDKRWTQPVQR